MDNNIQDENIWRRKAILTYIDNSPRANEALKRHVGYVTLYSPEEEEEIPEQMKKAEKRWMRHTVAAKQRWINEMKRARTYEEFCEGVAEFAGLSVNTVKESISAQRYKKFSENPRKYVDELIESVKSAAKKHEWAKGYRKAFGG